MLALLLALGLAHAEAPPAPVPDGVKWIDRIRYAVGVGLQVGVDPVGAPFPVLALEPAAFEWRSYLWDRVAWHTTFNVFRMIEPALARREGRIDYDLHVGAHLPLSPRRAAVIAPGASIAYAFAGGTGYQRFTGNLRVGVDLHGPRRLQTTSVLIRPYVGHARPVGYAEGRLITGVLAEVLVLWHLPKRWERATRPTSGMRDAAQGSTTEPTDG